MAATWTPILKGRRLNASSAYEPVPLATMADGTPFGESKVLSLHLCLDNGRLRLFDPATGEFLLTHRQHVDGYANERRLLADERRARKAAEAEVEEQGDASPNADAPAARMQCG